MSFVIKFQEIMFCIDVPSDNDRPPAAVFFFFMLISPFLTLLHSELPQLHRVLAVLSAKGLHFFHIYILFIYLFTEKDRYLGHFQW